MNSEQPYLVRTNPCPKCGSTIIHKLCSDVAIRSMAETIVSKLHQHGMLAKRESKGDSVDPITIVWDLLALPEAQPAPGWISVSDAMPKYSEDGPEFVLVFWKEEWRGRKLSGNKDDNSVASPSGFDSCFIPYFLARHYHQATHWKYVQLPLPSPPEPTPTKKENA